MSLHSRTPQDNAIGKVLHDRSSKAPNMEEAQTSTQSLQAQTKVIAAILHEKPEPSLKDLRKRFGDTDVDAALLTMEQGIKKLTKVAARSKSKPSSTPDR